MSSICLVSVMLSDYAFANSIGTKLSAFLFKKFFLSRLTKKVKRAVPQPWF